jgi:predicted SAM-dependent methyltransferase
VNPLGWVRGLVRSHWEMGWRIAPAWVVNYALITYVFVWLHLTSFLGVGVVFAGDVVALEINVFTFRKFGYPKTRGPSSPVQITGSFTRARQAVVRSMLHTRNLDLGCGDHLITPESVPADVVVNGINCVSLPFPDQGFDSVTALELFEHLTVQEQLETLAEVRRVLTPGGQLIVTVPNYKWYLKWFQDASWWIRERTTRKMYTQRKDVRGHVSMMHPRHLVSMLEAFGFRVLEERRVFLYDWLIRAQRN